MHYQMTTKQDKYKFISIELVPDPFIILGPDTKILDVNLHGARLLGKNRDKLIGKKADQIRILSTLSEKIARAIRKKSEETDHLNIDGRHFEVSILPLIEHKSVDMIRVILKDVTNFLRLESELRRRNRELIITSTLSGSFITSENLDHAVDDLLEKTILITDFSSAWLLTRERRGFRLKSSKGISESFRDRLLNGALDDFCTKIINRKEPLSILDTGGIAKMDAFNDENFTFITAIPLISDKTHQGLLFIASRELIEEHFDFDAAALFTLVGNTVSLILEKISLFQKTQHLSVTDGLTGLYNRRFFYKHLESEMSRAKRYGTSFSVAIFDIDNFKHINDTYGHLTGDDVLKSLARVLKLISRDTDVVARYGGEEFVIVLPNTGEAEAFTLANRIRSTAQANPFNLKKSKGITLTLSGGVATYPLNAVSAKSLLKASDAALYLAKSGGKNKVVCYEGFLNEKNI